MVIVALIVGSNMTKRLGSPTPSAHVEEDLVLLAAERAFVRHALFAVWRNIITDARAGRLHEGATPQNPLAGRVERF